MICLLNKAEIWLFYGFLVTFTLSIRKTLFFYPIRGQFNEYAGTYLYLSDIFILLLLMTSGLTIICNKIIQKSSGNSSFTSFLKQKKVILPLLLIFFSFISTFWSINWQIAVFKSIKLLEFYLLYLWVIFMFHVEHQDNQKCSTWNNFKSFIFIIVIIGVAQSIVGIWQFIIQKSIGLVWIRESILSPEISGVAKIIIDEEKYIRAYGLFPHPNILGGYLVLSIALTILCYKMFHVEHKNDKICPIRNKWLYWSVLGIQIIAIILTFSKSAWIGLCIAAICLWYQHVSAFSLVKGFGRSWHKNIKKMFHVEHFRYVTLSICILSLLVIISKPNWYSIVGKSIEDRLFFLNVSYESFLANPIFGLGSGQFVMNLESIKNIQNWQFQPVHNVFLLIINELGIVGLILFIWLIWKSIKNVPRGTTSDINMFHVEHIFKQEKNNDARLKTKAIFFSFLFIMLLDHYFWDIQQGQIMLWMVFGLVNGGKMCVRYNIGLYPQAKWVNN